MKPSTIRRLLATYGNVAFHDDIHTAEELKEMYGFYSIIEVAPHQWIGEEKSKMLERQKYEQINLH